jgi:hypothetical protein
MTLACNSRPYDNVLSSDGCAVGKIIKLAQRCNWKDPLTICRYVEGGTERTRSEPTCVLAHIAHTHRRAVVNWLFGECHDDVDENWELALQLSEEDDIMRCWMAEALCDTGKVLQARVLIEVQNSCSYLRVLGLQLKMYMSRSCARYCATCD